MNKKSSCLIAVPQAIFEALVKLISLPLDKVLAAPNKKYTRPLALVILTFFGCCLGFAALRGKDGTQSSPPPAQTAISQDDAMQTAWALVTKTEQAKSSQTPAATATISATETPAPTATALIPVTSQSCISPQQPQVARVTEVVDGDTIRVELDGSIYAVRYIGIDTPESTTQVEPFGKEASQKNSELVAGQTVTLYRDTSETDQFDRLLRFVFVGEKFINLELVQQGYAKSFRYPPDTSCADLFDQAQDQASAAGMGMWMAQATFAASSPAESLVITFVNKDAEYVDIQNRSNQPVDLTGWTLVSEKGSQSCSLGGTIQPGASLRIWAQIGGDGYSCGFGKQIWNNSASDPAVLYNPQYIEISRYP